VRVVHVTTALGPRGGGVARALLPLAASQAEGGAGVTLCSTEAPVRVPPGVRLLLGERLAPTRIGRSPDARRKLLAEPADLIHAHGLWQRPLAYAAEAAARARVPLVISPHGMLSPWARAQFRPLKWLAGRAVHPGAMRAASGWHAASELEADELRALGLTAPICVAPHGPIVADTAPERAVEHYLAAAPELAGRRVLLFYSRFHRKKRVRELIQLFARLAPRRPHWHLLLVGIPEQYRVGTLRSEAIRAGVGGRVSVLDGSDRPAPWPVAELMVLPSHSENFGLVVLEALLAERPVLTTTTTPWGDLREVGCGDCVPIEALPEALERLTGQPSEELRASGARGRAWARERFDWRRSAAELVRFYGSLSPRSQ